MKKLISLLLSVLMIFPFTMISFAEDMEYTKKTNEINIRDPYVLVSDGKYYMYGTGAAKGPGYGCYVSEDLENWAGPFNVFSAPEGFDGTKQFWAPECHYYNGNYYLFATYFSSSAQHRGVSVFRADNPLGPFTEISDGHITDHTQDAIDGTLYVDESGQPWMIYVHEWTCMPDGEGAMDAVKLSDDLSHFISEPVQLFKAKDPVWTDSFVTDGPFLYRTKYGKLLMLWSNNCDSGYCVGIAKSSDGTPDGKWLQSTTPVYKRNAKNTYDGGHGMLFETLDGKLMMCIHSPNSRKDDGTFETAKFIEMLDTGYGLIPSSTPSFIVDIIEFFSNLIFKITNLWK
ncbi:MAG: family 43 glycosylhydrolase [Clostridia bacterium]|nr:family 43 glycosylhydrolase [Clostridia bacterium]